MTNRVEVQLFSGMINRFAVKIDENEPVCIHRVDNKGVIEKEPFYKLPFGKKITLIIEVK